MKFDLQNTHEKRATMPSASLNLNKQDSPPTKIGEELFQEKYILRSECAVAFFSNDAQLPTKREQAEKNLRAFLYAEALPLVDELLLEAPNSEVFELASRLKKIMISGEGSE